MLDGGCCFVLGKHFHFRWRFLIALVSTTALNFMAPRILFSWPFFLFFVSGWGNFQWASLGISQPKKNKTETPGLPVIISFAGLWLHLHFYFLPDAYDTGPKKMVFSLFYDFGLMFWYDLNEVIEVAQSQGAPLQSPAIFSDTYTNCIYHLEFSSSIFDLRTLPTPKKKVSENLQGK